MLKKALLLLSAASVFLSASSGCYSSVGIADNAAVSIADVYYSTDQSYHDLSADGAIKVSDYTYSDKDFTILQPLGTNSTKITVANNSGAAVMVYLYYYGDTDTPIQQFSLDNRETKSFANLTSRFRYNISISADTDTRLDLTITD